MSPIAIDISVNFYLFFQQTEMDADSGEPKDELHPETLNWLKTLGIEHTKLTEILAAGPCPKVIPFCMQLAQYMIFILLLFVVCVLGVGGYK